MECEKLAQEKTEIQRQYIMVSEFNLKKIEITTFILYFKWKIYFKSFDANKMYNLSPFQYYEMSYGLNVEMHKQVDIFTRIY